MPLDVILFDTVPSPERLLVVRNQSPGHHKFSAMPPSLHFPYRGILRSIFANLCIALLAVSVVGDRLEAQATDQCRDVLLFSRTSRARAYSHQQSLAYLSLIRKDNYEDAQKSISTGLTAIVPPVAVDFNGNYDRFDQSRQHYFETHDIRWSQAEAEALTESFMPADAIVSWSKCMESAGHQLTVAATAIVRDEFTLRVDVKVPNVRRDLRVVSAVFRGLGTVAGQKPPLDTTVSLSPNGAHVWSIKRDCNVAFTLDLEVEAAGGAHLELPECRPDPFAVCLLGTPSITSPNGQRYMFDLLRGSSDEKTMRCPLGAWKRGSIIIDIAGSGSGALDPNASVDPVTKKLPADEFIISLWVNGLTVPVEKYTSLAGNYRFSTHAWELPKEAVDELAKKGIASVRIGTNHPMALGNAEPSVAVREIRIQLYQ